MTSLRLGLIGGNITESRAPTLHMLCGLMTGRNVTYDLLIPAEQGLDFAGLLTRCQAHGFAGVNVTYLFKERAAGLVPGDGAVRQTGAANTVIFGPDGPRAHNTDHSGFRAAYVEAFGTMAPGRVLLLGCGGVARAVAFALADLGAAGIWLYDTDAGQQAGLMQALAPHLPTHAADPGQLHDLTGFDGVVNATPLGMAERGGCALPADATGHLTWAFDAVYTPPETPFADLTRRLGARFLSGETLYFHQGLQAWALFSGQAMPDPEALRAALWPNRPKR